MTTPTCARAPVWKLKNERSERRTRERASDLGKEGELAGRAAGRRRRTSSRGGARSRRSSSAAGAGSRREGGALRRAVGREADGGNDHAIRTGFEDTGAGAGLGCVDHTEIAKVTDRASHGV